MSISLITSSGGLNKVDKQTVQDWMVEGHSIMNGKIEGTVLDKSNWSATINAGESITIPVGYHNGDGSVSAGIQSLHRVTLGSMNTNQYQGPVVKTFSVSNLPGYQNFTADNFALSYAQVYGSGSWTRFTYSLSYDASTGIVTVNNTVATDASGGYFSFTGNVTVVCYYVD